MSYFSYFLSTRWNNSPISNQQQSHPTQGDKALKFKIGENSFIFLSKVALYIPYARHCIFGTILCKVFVFNQNGLFSTYHKMVIFWSVVAKSECILKFNKDFYGMFFAIQIWVRLYIKVQISYSIWKCGKILRQISLCASFATAVFKCDFRWQQFYPTFKIQFPFVFATMAGISIFCPKIMRPFFHCLPPLYCCLPLWKTVRLKGKKLHITTNGIWIKFFITLDSEVYKAKMPQNIWTQNGNFCHIAALALWCWMVLQSHDNQSPTFSRFFP